MRPVGSAKRILLADDDPKLRELIRATLEGYFELLEAVDGEEALKISREEKPDLILLDIMMPKLDGFEVCRRLKSDDSTGSIKVIMLTARAAKEDIRRGEEVGADAYFVKPFSPKALLDKVNEVLS